MKWLRGGVLPKSFPKNFLKIRSEIPVPRSLSNNAKSFHGVRLATLLKKDPLTSVCGYTMKKVFLNNLENSRGST